MHEYGDYLVIRPIHVICEIGEVQSVPGGSGTVDNEGGLGRHLGLFSTTALMWVSLTPSAVLFSTKNFPSVLRTSVVRIMETAESS
jgi:hypothetical protein